MKKKLLSQTTKNNSVISLTKLFLISLILTLGFTQQSFAQLDAFITNKGVATICQGQSTTLQVIVSASTSPYTVVYSDGTSNFTVNNVYSI